MSDASNRIELLGALRSLYCGTRRHIAEVKRATGISAAMLWALDEIVRTPGMRAGELSARLAVHPATASNLVSKLKRAKLVNSQPDPADRRCVLLSASAAGRRLHAKAPEPKRGVLPAMIDGLDGAEVRRALAGLKALQAQVHVLGYLEDPLRPAGRA